MSEYGGLPTGMSEYEMAMWRQLQAHWQKKTRRRELVPPAAKDLLATAGRRSREVVSQAGEKLGEYTPEQVKRAGEFVVEEALVPVLKAAAHLLELAEDWAAEAMDPDSVLQYHRKNGFAVEKLADLHGIDLEPLDSFTRRMALQWRTLGAAEGAALGALSFVPVIGSGVGITADVLVMQMLSTAIASRALYSYGYDARHPGEQQVIEKMVRRTYRAQAPKAKAVRDASKAYKASRNRIRWSQKIRDDHKLMAAVERLMKQVSDGKVSIQDVSTKMPYIAVVTSAGTNAYVLGDTARQGVLYGRTRFLSEKYDLPLPAGLRHDINDDASNDDGDDARET